MMGMSDRLSFPLSLADDNSQNSHAQIHRLAGPSKDHLRRLLADVLGVQQ